MVVHASCSDPSLVLQYNYLSDGTLTASSPFTAIDNLSVYFEMPGFGTRYLECQCAVDLHVAGTTLCECCLLALY